MTIQKMQSQTADARALPMELLAPAGSMESLEAALRFGADAVYLAAERFGMRARAANFAMEEIPVAVALAHAAGAQVFVTCNILMNPQDIDELPGYFKALEAAGVDAFIIGDLGAFAVAGEAAPSVARHVSTQASVANAAAARVWHSLGAKRVVCAREMSLEDIRRLRQDTPPDLEIEAFVHGAMCMAVSGRCLISSYLTGRSGNRGHCTQPCRWSYTLEEEKRPGEHFPIEEDDRGTFIMNAKDLNMLEYLGELAAAGVDSIKIEGRNKKAFYVATVVGAYRQVLDGADPAEVRDELYAISHRPYGTGFYFEEAQQTPDYDGYEQETIHVADVLESTPQEGGALLTVRCRNRFGEGESLEAVVPHHGSLSGEVKTLEWLPTFGPDISLPDGPTTAREALDQATEDDYVAVEVANRSSCLYRFQWDGADGDAITPGSFLRSRTRKRTARHGAEQA